MSSLKKEFLRFADKLGLRLEGLGFSSKIIKSTNFYHKKTPYGLVGIHLNPGFYPTEGMSVNVSCAVSISSVQKILVNTELYEWDGGVTWTFGIDLSELRNEGRVTPQIPVVQGDNGELTSKLSDVLSHLEQYGSSGYDLDLNNTPQELEDFADRIWIDIQKYGWPFLQRYGSATGALELTMRDDDVSNLCFLNPQKALTALILARELGRDDIVPEIVHSAMRKFNSYEENGNAEPKDTFQKLVVELGLVNKELE